MARVNLKFDWTDCPTNEVQRRVELHFSSRSVNKAATYMDATRTAIRDLSIIPEQGSRMDIKSLSRRLAAFAQRRGVEQSNPCTNCEDGFGPFQECITFDGFLQGMCANCYFDPKVHKKSRQRCSHATLERAQAARDKVKKLENASGTKKRRIAADAGDYTTDIPEANRTQENIEPSWNFHPMAPTQGMVHVMGNVSLPHPAQQGLEEDYIKLIFSILPHLHQLEHRNLHDLSGRIDLKEAFENFKAAEKKAWDSSKRQYHPGTRRVWPSGSLDSQIAHHLHQPSFTSDETEDGPTGDLTNPCIAMIMGNGFEVNTLLFDDLHRSDEESHGRTTWPQEVLDVHDEFTKQIQSSSAAKVEIVYGKHVQDRIIKTMKTSALPLYGSFNGITLILVHESNFSNEDKNYQIRKIMLFVVHPQYVFHLAKGTETTIQQDRTLRLASELLGLKPEFVPQYYELRKWQAKMPSIYSRVIQKLNKTQHLAALSQEDKNVFEEEDEGAAGGLDHMNDDGSCESGSGKWDCYFDSQAHSNARSRELIPEALTEIEDSIVSMQRPWTDLSHLSPKVEHWFRGQKNVLFYEGPASSSEDIVKVLKKCTRNQESPATESFQTCTRDLRYILRDLINVQQHHLAAKESNYSLDDVSFTRADGSTVETICPCGEFKSIDKSPRFMCAMKSVYITRESRRCKSSICSAKLHTMEPICEELLAVRNREEPRNRWYVPRMQAPTQFETALRKLNDLNVTPDTVEMWCLKCKENGRYSKPKSEDERHIWIDKKARWTLGQRRPLLVLRHATCLQCWGNRMIPIDENIPSIHTNSLAEFVRIFSNTNKLVKGIILDEWPASTREPREAKRK